jgi:competence protein ComEA
MNWKDYFYFTKTERNGIFVLIILIVIVLIFPMIYRSFIYSEKVYDFSNFEKNIAQYEKLLEEYHAAKVQTDQPQKPENLSILNLTYFNPNEITEQEWLEMGLPASVFRNLSNYRNAGGQFRFREDLKKIYSLDKNLYAQLETFIQLPTQTLTPEKSLAKMTSMPASQQTIETKPTFKIDINKADTLQWQKIRGIGSVFSTRIIKYREQLGGFHSLDQLLEVYGMDRQRFDRIAEHLTVDSNEIHKIDLNTSNFALLVKHPYLNRNQVNSIIKIRDIHGAFTSIDEIKKSELICDSVFLKLAPYLTIGLLP